MKINFNDCSQYASRDMNFYFQNESTEEKSSEELNYDVIWKKTSSIDACKTKIAMIVEAFSLIFEIYQIISNYVGLIFKPSAVNPSNSANLNVFVIAIVLTFVMFVLTALVHRICKFNLRQPVGLGNFSLKGEDGKLSLEKVSATCPKCGNVMRYYNKPVAWRDEIKNGTVKSTVTKRRPAFECKANSDHCYFTD